jgi:hypothetical protein
LKVGGGRPCRSYSAAIARRARLAWVQGWAASTPRTVDYHEDWSRVCDRPAVLSSVSRESGVCH